ncbi:uncharacterized protein LOC143529630 [Bidens hawaiensis]|uniref:uncharacterized protein LOC143529630 n=1 Tax=Bidens hawaiensis TaxID=980011 RepID=UPI0040494E91
MEVVLRVSKCKGEDMVTFATASFRSEVLCWSDNLVQAMGDRSIRRMTWVELKKLVLDQFCPPHELDKIEQDFLTLEAGSMTHREYTMKFNKMARLCPDLVTPEAKRIKKYEKGLPADIRRGVMTTNMNSFHSVVTLAGTLYDQREKLPPTETRKTWNSNSYGKRPGGNNFNSAEKRAKIENSDFKKDVAFVKCKKCGKQHKGECKHGSSSCFRCDKVGHPYFECPTLTYFRCKGAGHLASNCPTIKTCGDPGTSSRGKLEEKPKVRARAFNITKKKAKDDADVVSGTYLLDEIQATVLFDSGASRSFVSTTFCSLLNKLPERVVDVFDVEVAVGKSVSVSRAIQGCTIELSGYRFPVRLYLMPLGYFDVVLGMDWLASVDDQIICGQKLVRLRAPDGTHIMVFGDRNGATPPIISMLKARKLVQRGCGAYLAYAINVKTEDATVGDVPIGISRMFFLMICQICRRIAKSSSE